MTFVSIFVTEQEVCFQLYRYTVSQRFRVLLELVRTVLVPRQDCAQFNYTYKQLAI